MTRVVVDPITRIEGHLRIEAVVENGVITDAYSAGTMVRGLEKILVGRDPRDAWAITERVCGVCTTVHALTSVRAVESALGITVPPTAELIRNIMMTTQYVQDHVIHFYHLHALDWVDIVNALKADPKKAAEIAASYSSWDKNTAAYFSSVQDKIKAFAASGLGIFANGYWGHPAYKLPPEVNLIAVAHYLDALEWQKEIVKIHAVFGGKNPHPNYLVGGVPCSISANEVAAINTERLNLVSSLISQATEFVNQVYIPDVLTVAGFYKDWAQWGGGLTNYLSYGEFPTKGYNQVDSFRYPRGVVLNRDLSQVHPVNARDNQEIKEYIAHSWYTYDGGDSTGLHPWSGETRLNYTGPKPPFESLEGHDKYSFLKTPRWKEQPMEVGPLARLIVAYAAGNTDVKALVGQTLGKLNVPTAALFSTLGRTAARALDAELALTWLKQYFNELLDRVRINEVSTFNGEHWEPKTWPAECEGVGLTEAPRGALAHFIKIRNSAIENYQLVVPTTWNGSPRDVRQQRSSFEQALIGTPVANLEQPVEILRTIHSFDPCLACAVHLYDPQGRHLHQVSFE
ncbi:MAG: nickel-dependent hydrogenase large subunit [Acidobacteriota bacterium]|nr:nickel-dependent hydrogenase large subunit [Acidobacteriota bacterium]MDE3162277.1 nickel-dependent hydrogenase large subunit [Acidobacteriota bacterium]